MTKSLSGRQNLAIFIAVICILVCVPAVSAEFTLPHIFYGNVTINTLPAPNGTYINAVVAGGEGNFTTTIPGKYGNPEPDKAKLEVQGANIENDAPITFFVNGIHAECYDVDSQGPWLEYYPFEAGEDTHLNLAITGPAYTISASAGDGGTISPSGSVPVIEGTNKTFTIAPDSCHIISTVLVNGITVGAVPEYTFTNVTSNQTIHATFTAKTVYISASAGSGGSISPSGLVPVLCGNNQTFTISPSTGHYIGDVMVDGVSVGALSEVTVGPVTDNWTVVAYFTPFTFTINATAGLNGNISPSGIVPVSYGDDISFTITPDTGYRINSLLVNGNLTTSQPVYTFYNVSANQTIAVTFGIGPPDYFIVYLGNGWNTFSTPVDLAAGHKQLDEIFPAGSIEKIEVILGWDGSKWFIPNTAQEKEVNPLWAFYIKVKGNTTGYIYPNPEVKIGPPVPERILGVGPNLIGPAPAFMNCTFSEMTVKEALVSVDYEGGYSIAVSPSLIPNQEGWAVSRLGNDTQYFEPYKGYWVYMVESGTLIGFSQTPLSC
ncbi:MAG: hypothetical protein MUE45_00435 [Methanoregulaceae archaeon]|nr:hypothetical protein [Methanoregulaceae archaeon]MCU0627946.1 hypothetical protein [Methanoregulaceae archaeon]